MKKKSLFIQLQLIVLALFLSATAWAANPRPGFYIGQSGTTQISYQITSTPTVDSLSGLVPLSCVASDGATSTYILSLNTGAGPVRMRNAVATFRNYRYNFSSDTRITLNGTITASEARLAVLLVSPESTCRGSLRVSVRRTNAPILKNYDTDASDPRGTVAITFKGTKLTTHVIYVLGICGGITNVIAAGDVVEPSGIVYRSNGDFSFTINKPGSIASIVVSVNGVRNVGADTYTLGVEGSVTNELGTCGFSGSFVASRV